MIYRLFLVIIVAGMLWLPASVLAQDQSTPGLTIHVVQRGENLFRIALNYGLTTDELARLNGITDPGNIQVGQRLLVPAAAAPANVQPLTHVVQAGETFESIAGLYNISLQTLLSDNNITDVNSIYVGEILTIIPTHVPAAVAEPSQAFVETSTTNVMVHVVQPGETLFRIANNYGLTVNDLAQANGIADPTLIYTGQQLIVPGVELPQLAVDLPQPVARFEVLPLILVEGQTARFRLTTTIPENVSAAFLGRTLPLALEQNGTVATALTGVPMFTEAGVYPLAFTLSEGNGQQVQFSVNVQVVSGSYGSEAITLLSDRTGLLDPAVDSTEQNLVQRIMSAFTPQRYFEGPMSLPAAATVTSPFGTRRAYNGGGFDRFHMGTDFAGAPGTPVLAAASGYVVLADTLNVRGNATIIDHGWGVFTGYWHQSEQYVKLGDFVTAGQMIGTIGATGRVTGAHLHWELWVGGVPVDPMQWVRQSFS